MLFRQDQEQDFILSLIEALNLCCECSWDARQHQFNFIRRLSWSISSNFGV